MKGHSNWGSGTQMMVIKTEDKDKHGTSTAIVNEWHEAWTLKKPDELPRLLKKQH